MTFEREGFKRLFRIFACVAAAALVFTVCLMIWSVYRTNQGDPKTALPDPVAGNSQSAPKPELPQGEGIVPDKPEPVELGHISTPEPSEPDPASEKAVLPEPVITAKAPSYALFKDDPINSVSPFMEEKTDGAEDESVIEATEGTEPETKPESVVSERIVPEQPPRAAGNPFDVKKAAEQAYEAETRVRAVLRVLTPRKCARVCLIYDDSLCLAETEVCR